MTEPTQPPAPPEEPQDAPRECRLDAESADNTTDALLRQPQLRETSERQALDAALHQAKLVHEFADRPPQPVPFRRWEVRRRIGRGAMGAVYLARDPALGRDVALKLISSVDGAPLPLHATREARALAAIAHPNVVQIHSVDESSPRTLILEMEYVDGPHLGAWAATPGRPWRDLVTAIAGAGDGLAALHAKAILHRDIKPENIVIGRDGRPRLVDFGLAVARDRGSRRGEGPATPSASPLALHLSAAGALHGTLGYLAPEVLLSDQATPQSDLFSLASTLFTGLYGHLPYHGESPKDLAQALRAGRLAIPDDAPRYPAWLLRILRRALAFDPEERPQEVAEFVHELRRGLGRRRRLLGIMGLLGAVVTLPLVGWTLGPAPADPCAEAGAEFAVIAAADRIPSLRDRLGAAAIPPQTIASLEGLLHTRRQGWTAAARQSCLRGQQRPRWVGVSGVEDLRRERCLAATARRLDHLLGLPAAPKTEHPATERHGLQQLTAIFAALEALPTCDGAELYHWTPSRDPAALDRLDHALGLALAGTYAAAATLAAELAASPELDPYHRAEAHYLVGYSHGQRRQLRTAALALTRARDLAFASGHDVLLCRITAYQAKLAAVALLDAGAAERLIADAAACAARLGPRAPLLGAELAEAHGLVAEVRGDPTTAAAHHRRALRLRSAILGEDHLDTTRSLHNLGNSLGERGSPGDRLAALGHLRQAVERRRRALGSEDPLVADVLLDLGVLHSKDDSRLAREAFIEARRIYTAHPDDHAGSALKAVTALAQLDLEDDDLPGAATRVAAGRLLLTPATAELSPGHPALADFRGIAGQVAARQDDFVTAEAELAAGLHSLPETARVRRAALLAEWIEAATATGRRGALIRALLGSLKIDPPGPPQLAPELLAHLENEAAARRGTLAWYAADALQGATLATEAVPFLRVAVAAYEELVASADDPPLRDLSELRFELARALAAEDPAEARTLAAAAAAGYRTLGRRREAAAIDRWRRTTAPP